MINVTDDERLPNSIKLLIIDQVDQKMPLIEDVVSTTFLVISGVLLKSWKEWGLKEDSAKSSLLRYTRTLSI